MSKLDKIFWQAMQFHADVRKRAAAMELWIIIHALGVVVSYAFLDLRSWQVAVPVLLLVNGAVILYQRIRLEKDIEELEDE